MTRDLDIFFQNEYFVALHKPSLTLTVPGREGDKDPRPVLGIMLQKLVNKKVYPVHRLDFGVSGVVLFALTADAHKDANGWFEKRDVQKTYQALTQKKSVKDIPLEKEFVWKSLLVRGKKRVFEAAHGHESLTEAKYLGVEKDEHRWQLSPLTGRSHQLRYELSKFEFPILGDELYGSNQKWADGIALRAVELDFTKTNFEKWKLPRLLQAQKLFLP